MMGNMTGRVKNSMKIESRDWSWVKMHRATAPDWECSTILGLKLEQQMY